MVALVDLPFYKSNGYGGLIKKIVTLLPFTKGDKLKGLYQRLTGGRVSYELYIHLVQLAEKEIEEASMLCARSILDYYKANPNAPDAEVINEVAKFARSYKERVESLYE